ncbi:hypothetical protein ANFP_22960 [Acidithiobacillus ferrooxidans]|nr:hypothetical protein ANFP_22960 [Acidithiobacillus ferrooxidans]
MVKGDHVLVAVDPAIPSQSPSPERVAGIIGIDGEQVAATSTHLMQVTGNDRAVQ